MSGEKKMRRTKCGILGRLAGMLAILVLSTMQEPAAVNAMASANQDCRGGLRGGCIMCDAEDEDGTPCLVFICDGGAEVNYWCWPF